MRQKTNTSLKARDFVALGVLFFVCLCFSSEARQITDMAGRKVTVPDVIHKVYGTSPPATYMLYAVDPTLVAGLNFAWQSSDKKFIDPRLHDLSVVGGWFGQGQVANLETLLQVKPDIILVWMWSLSSFNEKLEKSLKPLNIPLVYVVMDALDEFPAAFRFLGDLFNQQERAEALSRYSEQVLNDAEKVRSAIPESGLLSVYYAEGPDGLSTECNTSVHAQLIPLSGSINVHRCVESSHYGMQKISMEQVLKYDPQVIIYHEPLFTRKWAADARWQNIRAVSNGRVYKIPRTPFNWFDRPPSFMRLLGLKWMMRRLYPDIYPIDLVAETRHFYKLFLNVTLDEAAARELLQP
jgi:iron complex transport system substrate-binding protein